MGERVAAAGLGDVEPLRDAVRVVETLRVAVPEREGDDVELGEGRIGVAEGARDGLVVPELLVDEDALPVNVG